MSGRVADFIEQANTVSQASAATRGSLAQNLKDFPPFLKQLGPAMERIQRFAEQTTPTFTALKAAAPGINKTFTSLPAFSKSTEKFLVNLGKTSKVSGPALVATKPLLKRLKTLGGAAVPFSSNFASLLESVRNTGGLERILDFIFMGAGSANGYDALGHFLRAEGVGNGCLTYAVAPSAVAGCRRKFFSSSGTSASASAASSAGTSTMGLVMARTLAVVKGATPAQALAKYPGSAPSASELGVELHRRLSKTTTTQPVGGSTAGTTYYTPSSAKAKPAGCSSTTCSGTNDAMTRERCPSAC